MKLEHHDEKMLLERITPLLEKFGTVIDQNEKIEVSTSRIEVELPMDVSGKRFESLNKIELHVDTKFSMESED